MKKHDLQLRRFRVLLSLVLLAVVILITSSDIYAQSYNKPQIPVLSLNGGGRQDDYNPTWYPDGRIWLPVSNAGGPAREFLLPVFIDNKWYHYKSSNKSSIYVPDPIYSFEFKLYFDSAAIQPVGIQTFHPFRDSSDARALNNKGDYREPLAKDFTITWNEMVDKGYRSYFLKPGDAGVPTRMKERGRAMKIIGSSSFPLPTCDTAKEELLVLLYVKFRLKLEYGKISPAMRDAENTPIYIAPDTVKWNDLNVRADAPFKNFRKYYPYIQDDYPDPDAGTGLGGVFNDEKNDDGTWTDLWQTEPTLRGTIYLRLTEKIPDFWYLISRTGTQPPIWTHDDNAGQAAAGEWILRDPITVDSSRSIVQTGDLNFTLIDKTSESRLVDIDIESDQPWLTFNIVSKNTGKYTPSGTTTKGYVYYIDNSILGRGSDAPDPNGNATAADEIVTIQIHCDPTKIVDGQTPYEKAGVYVGYITFRSTTASVNPIRMRVTFINYRNPVEPDDNSYAKAHKGITLNIRNSEGATGKSTRVTFGTAHRATDGVDPLCGEFAHKSAIGGFSARLYHPDEEFRRNNNIIFGFGDMLPSVEAPYGESRDIRNINDTTESYIFLCRFNANGANNYPVVVSWDTLDFPDGAQLYLSDTLNGGLFPSVNMRKATHISGTSLGYIIEDPSITSFKIEYTIPRVVKYLDAYGKPTIKTGWNFLSLAARPKNATYHVVFPNAINRPYFFTQNQFQDEDVMRPGVGYFMKYSNNVDTAFPGIRMKRITLDADGLGEDGYADVIKIYPGWNSIGALSYPMNVKDIQFDEFMGQRPSLAYVKKFGVWGYKTNEGYFETSMLESGYGYWMKADENKHGYLKLVLPTGRVIGNDLNNEKKENLDNATNIKVRDNAQHEGNVFVTNDSRVDVSTYELPPVPPSELFDIRLNNGGILTSDNESIVRLQGITYPLSITLNNEDASYTFVDAITGLTLGTIAKGSQRNLEIAKTAGDAIRILKSEAIAGPSVSVTPNPVDMNSTINLVATENGRAVVKLYDVLGNEVSTLFDGSVTAGRNIANFNATGLSNGRYIVKMTVGATTVSTSVTIAK